VLHRVERCGRRGLTLGARPAALGERPPGVDLMGRWPGQDLRQASGSAGASQSAGATVTFVAGGVLVGTPARPGDNSRGRAEAGNPFIRS
jgi:hypothetical protein